MSEEQKRAVDSAIRHSGFDPGGEVDVERVAFARLLASIAAPDDVETTRGELDGVPVITVEVGGARASGWLFWVHGGFFAYGSAEASVPLAADVARASGMRVVTVEYDLAPEHPYPHGLDQVRRAYRAFVQLRAEDGYAAGGESAGANLVLTAVLEAVRDGAGAPSSLVLMSPWVDLGGTGATVTEKAEADPVISARAVRRRAADYLGPGDLADPRVSPLHADLGGLPPLLIQAGSHEVLLDDALRLGASAARADVDVVIDVVSGVSHVFQAYAAVLDEGRAALARVGAFLAAHLPARGSGDLTAATDGGRP